MQLSNAIASLPRPRADLLSRQEAAEYLGVSPNTLASWSSSKRYNLPFIKIGHLAKYRRPDLDEFISSRAVCGKAA